VFTAVMRDDTLELAALMRQVPAPWTPPPVERNSDSASSSSSGGSDDEAKEGITEPRGSAGGGIVALLALLNAAGHNALDLARTRNKRQAEVWLEARLVEHLKDALPEAYGGGRRRRGAVVLELAQQLTPTGAAGPERRLREAGILQPYLELGAYQERLEIEARRRAKARRTRRAAQRRWAADRAAAARAQRRAEARQRRGEAEAAAEEAAKQAHVEAQVAAQLAQADAEAAEAARERDAAAWAAKRLARRLQKRKKKGGWNLGIAGLQPVVGLAGGGTRVADDGDSGATKELRQSRTLAGKGQGLLLAVGDLAG
jgi:hypothetical protein